MPGDVVDVAPLSRGGHAGVAGHDEEMGATARATNAIRDMIMHRRLMPGTQLRQGEFGRASELVSQPVARGSPYARDGGVCPSRSKPRVLRCRV